MTSAPVPRRWVATVVALALAACGRRVAVIGPPATGSEHVPKKEDRLCVLTPADWRAGDTVSAGSGAIVAQHVARALREDGRTATVLPHASEQQARASCAAAHGLHLVVPTILAWEDAQGPRPFGTFRITIEVGLRELGGQAGKRAFTFSAEERRGLDLAGTRTGDLLDERFERALRALIAPP